MNGRFDKRALAGCIVMAALGLGAVVLHVERGELSDIWPFRQDDAAMTAGGPDASPDASPISEAPPRLAHNDTSDADVAFMLQSISDNLQRNDLAAARVLLNAVLDVHKDLPQALALQQELHVRELKASRSTGASATTAAADAEINGTNDNTATTKTDLAQARPLDTRSGRTVQHKKVATRDKSHERSHRTLSAAQRNHMAKVSNGRPKTRAEVVAELQRARADGTMPNFGGRQR